MLTRRQKALPFMQFGDSFDTEGGVTPATGVFSQSPPRLVVTSLSPSSPPSHLHSPLS